MPYLLCVQGSQVFLWKRAKVACQVTCVFSCPENNSSRWRWRLYSLQANVPLASHLFHTTVWSLFSGTITLSTWSQHRKWMALPIVLNCIHWPHVAPCSSIWLATTSGAEACQCKNLTPIFYSLLAHEQIGPTDWLITRQYPDISLISLPVVYKRSRNFIGVFILKGTPEVIQTPCDLAGAIPGAGPHSQEGCFSMDNWRCLFVEDSMNIL